MDSGDASWKTYSHDVMMMMNPPMQPSPAPRGLAQLREGNGTLLHSSLLGATHDLRPELLHAQERARVAEKALMESQRQLAAREQELDEMREMLARVTLETERQREEICLLRLHSILSGVAKRDSQAELSTVLELLSHGVRQSDANNSEGVRLDSCQSMDVAIKALADALDAISPEDQSESTHIQQEETDSFSGSPGISENPDNIRQQMKQPTVLPYHKAAADVVGGDCQDASYRQVSEADQIANLHCTPQHAQCATLSLHEPGKSNPHSPLSPSVSTDSGPGVNYGQLLNFPYEDMPNNSVGDMRRSTESGDERPQGSPLPNEGMRRGASARESRGVLAPCSLTKVQLKPVGSFAGGVPPREGLPSLVCLLHAHVQGTGQPLVGGGHPSTSALTSAKGALGHANNNHSSPAASVSSCEGEDEDVGEGRICCIASEEGKTGACPRYPTPPGSPRRTGDDAFSLELLGKLPKYEDVFIPTSKISSENGNGLGSGKFGDGSKKAVPLETPPGSPTLSKRLGPHVSEVISSLTQAPFFSQVNNRLTKSKQQKK